MGYRVEITVQDGNVDARGEGLLRQARDLGVKGLTAVSVIDLYFLEGDLDHGAVERLVNTVLLDPVVEQASWRKMEPGARAGEEMGQGWWSVEVALLPGVTDTVASNLVQGAQVAGITGVARAAYGQRYVLRGEMEQQEVRRIAGGLLANEVIQSYTINREVDPPLAPAGQAEHEVELVILTEVDDEGLLAISADRRLSLNLEEMRAIQAYYRQQERQPTDLELEMLAQTWSEHCVHKTFRARITYQEIGADGAPDPQSRQVVDSMLRTYIKGATEKAARPWVHSAFVDNAGIVGFDDELDLAFKLETHNHPSALEPFGGANTGVGGVVRDVMGVSARPMATTDVLCFGPPDLPFEELPDGLLHPRRIADGVTAGIEDYGNKMGIPTVNGAIVYRPGYTANPLVFCGCLGVLPHGSHPTNPQAGDLVVSLGGRTGRDGLRGATFSSMEMTHETGQVAGSAVQIGHPIMEKQVLEVQLLARDEKLYNAITDCGAGGLSSAVGEMGATLGAEVHLERVTLKYPGLHPWEIWLSEAQERMVMAVPQENWPRLKELCARFDVQPTAVGHFTGDGELTLFYGEQQVGRLSTEFLHHGIPRREMQALWDTAPKTEPSLPLAGDLTADLLALLADPDTRSKEDVVRRYDHEVQAGTVVKPLVGLGGHGPSDAAVLVPLEAQERSPGGSQRAAALSVGINPSYGSIDPYNMAWAAVDEAMRNCVAVGADPDQVSLLDNFCWGNPAKPDRLAGLVRCARGCHDAAVAFCAPFISGKDSLNNEYQGADGRQQAIPGTLLVSALGIVPDIGRTVTMDLKEPGNALYLVGRTADELGGSSYYRRHGHLGANVPQPPQQGMDILRALHRAMSTGLVRSCHDCSEGGLAVAAAEMCLAGGLGLDLNLESVTFDGGSAREDVLAFSESLCRFLVEVAPEQAAAFEEGLAGLPLARVGSVRDDDRLVVAGLDSAPVIQTTVEALHRAWR